MAVSEPHSLSSELLPTLPPPEFVRRRGWGQRLLDRLTAPLRYFFGDDIFISYSRADGLNYAQGIASQLAAPGWDYSCRVDIWETEPGKEMPASLRRALRWSKMLVLVGTPGAARSFNVGQEVVDFRATGGIIVPIDFGGAIPSAFWFEEIQGLPLSFETSEALETGHPSARVTMRVRDSFEYVKRSQRVRRTFYGLLGLVGVVLLAGLWLVWVAQRQLADAGAQEQGLRAIMLARSPGHEKAALALAVGATEQYPNGPVASPNPVFGGLLFSLDAVAASLPLVGHQARVSNMFMLPGYRLVTMSADRTVRLWDIRTGRGWVFRGQLTTAETGALAPDSSLLVTTSPLRVWDVAVGHERVVAAVNPLAGERFQAVAWSADGSRLAALSVADSGAAPRVWVWEVRRASDSADVQLTELSVPWQLLAEAAPGVRVRDLAFLPGQPERLLLSTTGGVLVGDLRTARVRPLGA